MHGVIFNFYRIHNPTETPMVHDTKIGVIVRDDLQTWQKLNVTAFLTSGIAAAYPETIGQAYEDGSGKRYLPLFVQPVFVYSADSERLQRTRARSESREVPLAVYTEGMFATNNDVDNRALVKALPSESLDLVGIAFRADSKTFDKIISGLKFHS
jgi:hypothetical protein